MRAFATLNLMVRFNLSNNTIRKNFNTFNNLSTTNKVLSEEVDAWMKNLVKKSSIISGVNEKQRHQIFKKIKMMIRLLETFKIMTMICKINKFSVSFSYNLCIDNHYVTLT